MLYEDDQERIFGDFISSLANEEFSLCKSYPEKIPVPEGMGVAEVVEVRSYSMLDSQFAIRPTVCQCTEMIVGRLPSRSHSIVCLCSRGEE